MLERSELSPAGRPLASARALTLPLERLFAAFLLVTLLTVAAGSAWRADLKSDVSGLRWAALLALCGTGVALAWSCASQARVTSLERRGALLASLLLGLCFLSTAWSVDPKLTFERAGTVALVLVTAASAGFAAARADGLVLLVVRTILVAVGVLLLASLILYAVHPAAAMQLQRFRGVEENP